MFMNKWKTVLNPLTLFFKYKCFDWFSEEKIIMFLEIVLFHSIMENVKMSIGRFGRKILNVRLKVFKKKPMTILNYYIMDFVYFQGSLFWTFSNFEIAQLHLKFWWNSTKNEISKTHSQRTKLYISKNTKQSLSF